MSVGPIDCPPNTATTSTFKHIFIVSNLISFCCILVEGGLWIGFMVLPLQSGFDGFNEHSTLIGRMGWE